MITSDSPPGGIDLALYFSRYSIAFSVAALFLFFFFFGIAFEGFFYSAEASPIL